MGEERRREEKRDEVGKCMSTVVLPSLAKL
jgi:hypothetical protein